MTETPPPPPTDHPTTSTKPELGTQGWDPAQVMKDRAATSRRQRDTAIGDLRAQLSDEQVLEEFGIVLGEIER